MTRLLRGAQREGTPVVHREVRVKVVPRAPKEHVARLSDGRLLVSVCAPAKGGKANADVCRLVAEHLHVDKAHVLLLRGHHTPTKTLRLTGATFTEEER